jgi:hypothetical protein
MVKRLVTFLVGLIRLSRRTPANIMQGFPFPFLLHVIIPKIPIISRASYLRHVNSTSTFAFSLRSTNSPFYKYYHHRRGRLDDRNLRIHTSTHCPFDTFPSFVRLSRSQHKVLDLSNAPNDLNPAFPISTVLYLSPF